MKPVRLDDEAQAEIDAAVSWYDVNAETIAVGDFCIADAGLVCIFLCFECNEVKATIEST